VTGFLGWDYAFHAQNFEKKFFGRGGHLSLSARAGLREHKGLEKMRPKDLAVEQKGGAAGGTKKVFAALL